MKITRYGHIEWVQKLGGGATDTEISAFEDTVLSSDRQYLYGVGRFTLGDFPGEHTATIGNISLRMDGCMPTGSGALLVKMRADTGEVVYARIINADYCGDTYGHAICLDAANNIYVVGEYYPKTNWTFAGTKLTENGPFILKYDANFVEKWITTPMTNAYGWFCTYDADKSRVAWGGYYINKTNNPAMGVWGHYTAGKDPIATLSNGTVINGPTGIAELGFLVSTDPTNGATKAVSFGNRHNDIVKHGNYYYTPGTVHIETAEHPLRAGIVTKVDSTTLQPVKEWIVEGDGKVNGKAITVDSSGNVYFAGTTKALSGGLFRVARVVFERRLTVNDRPSQSRQSAQPTSPTPAL